MSDSQAPRIRRISIQGLFGVFDYVLPEFGKDDLGETVMATPAISADVIYMRGRKHLFAIGRKQP